MIGLQFCPMLAGGKPNQDVESQSATLVESCAVRVDLSGIAGKTQTGNYSLMTRFPESGH
jgi:hypothetical protein